MKKHLSIKVSGRVQGVFFRASAKQKALSLGLTGFAQNLPDGSVHLEVEGEEDSLREFLSWCHKGPLLARVDHLEFEFSDHLKGFSSFETF